MPSISQVEIAPLTKLRLSKRNARSHSKKQIQQIANSILRFGWTYPILVDENGDILAGAGDTTRHNCWVCRTFPSSQFPV